MGKTLSVSIQLDPWLHVVQIYYIFSRLKRSVPQELTFSITNGGVES